MSLGKAMIHARKQKSIAKAAAYSGDYAAEDTRAIFGAAADAFETGPMGVSPSA